MSASQKGRSEAQPFVRAFASCLATATVISMAAAADAALLDQTLEASDVEGSGRRSSPAVLTVAEEDGSSGAGDVLALVRDLERAQSPEGLLNAMVNINTVVDDGGESLDDPFAKEVLVNSLLTKRRSTGTDVWDSDAQVAFSILKRKLDPYNVVLLRPYLKVAPYLGGVGYLGAFFVQQRAREFFPLAYFSIVALLVAPAAFILVTN
ncbi:unnamed protein product [Discosporangium mesarthrocarpum]